MKRGCFSVVDIGLVPFMQLNNMTLENNLYLYDENTLADETYSESGNSYLGNGFDGILQIEFSAESVNPAKFDPCEIDFKHQTSNYTIQFYSLNYVLKCTTLIDSKNTGQLTFGGPNID